MDAVKEKHTRIIKQLADELGFLNCRFFSRRSTAIRKMAQRAATRENVVYGKSF
jgi:hypothetical protein